MAQPFDPVTTERLLLRPPRETDVEAVFALHGDPETNQFSISGPLRSRDAARARLELWLEDWAQRGVGYWAVELRESPGAVVGFGGVRHKLVEEQPVLNLYYRLVPRLWGAGYATELSRAALAFARAHVSDTPVVAIIQKANHPSIRVAERLGMRFDRMIDLEGVPSCLYVQP